MGFNNKIFGNLFLMLFLFACGEPEFDNPVDPDNPDFEIPETIILSGPQEGETVDTSSVTFSWEGNEQAVEYAYQLNEGGWSLWTKEPSITLNYLDEGDHYFQVKSRYISEDEDETPAEINFTVDAVHGPALRVFPLLTTTSVSQPTIIEIYMEEVENIMASEFSVSYNPLLVTVESVSKGELLSNYNGESVLIYETQTVDSEASIIFDIGVATRGNAGLIGSGSIISIEFMPVSIGDFDVEILTESTFRDNNNLEIIVNQSKNGRFEIE